MAGLGAKAGGQYALHRARKVFASAERHAELDAAFELQTAESIAEALGNMKGAMMKLGQMASYLDQGMPEPVREALAELQANAPPMSAELAAQVVRGGAGRAAGGGVRHVGPEADRGGVDRAGAPGHHQGRPGRRGEGAVPGRRRRDPGRPRQRRDAVRRHGDDAPGPRARARSSRSCARRLVEELDYVKEADNQRLFADYYAGHPFIHVPAVVDELCAERVLTTELAEGVRFDEVETWSQEERDLAAEAIFRFVFGSLYRLHAFNGDPHPGNYLFQPGGQVTFLDFGLVKRFEPRRGRPHRRDAQGDGRRQGHQGVPPASSRASGC